jgi:hypothetical protein
MEADHRPDISFRQWHHTHINCNKDLIIRLVVGLKGRDRADLKGDQEFEALVGHNKEADKWVDKDLNHNNITRIIGEMLHECRGKAVNKTLEIRPQLKARVQ